MLERNETHTLLNSDEADSNEDFSYPVNKNSDKEMGESCPSCANTPCCCLIIINTDPCPGCSQYGSALCNCNNCDVKNGGKILAGVAIFFTIGTTIGATFYTIKGIVNSFQESIPMGIMRSLVAVGSGTAGWFASESLSSVLSQVASPYAPPHITKPVIQTWAASVSAASGVFISNLFHCQPRLPHHHSILFANSKHQPVIPEAIDLVVSANLNPAQA